MFDALGLLFGLLLTVVTIAAGVYIGALRALDVYFGGKESAFLSDDRERFGDG